MTQRSKTLSSMLLVAALCAGLAVGACGDSDSKGGGQIGETITVEISAMTGGIVADRSGTASLVIPPMALEEDTTITLDVFQGNSQTESHIYEFGPDGLTFSIPATLSIVVDPMTEEGSDWLLAVEVNGTFVPLEGSAYVLGAIAAPIHHFSRFALISEPDDTGAGGSGGGEGTGGAGGEGGVGGTGAGGMGGTGGTGGSGGQGGAGGTGGGPGLACLDELDAFTPCGGDLTGRWTIQSTCLDGIFPGPWSICDGLEGDGATVSLGEGFYYEFTETEVSSPATTVSAVAAVSYPASCFGGVSCSESSIPGFAQCDGTTTCTCHVDAVMPEEPKTANYEIDGGRLIIDDPIEQQEFEYCVQGDKLLLVSVANPSSSDRSLSIGTRN